MFRLSPRYSTTLAKSKPEVGGLVASRTGSRRK